MFDELHDPKQPEATMKTLADVTERARAIRRRRTAWAGAGAVVLVVAATVGVIAARRGDGDSVYRLLPATVPSNPSTPHTAPATTTPATEEPATTSVTIVPVLPTTISPETSTTVPAITRPIVAIDGNGDAVIVSLDGTTTVLKDGPDPDDPPPTEGETYSIDAVAISDTGSNAIVGVCCEPVVGSLLWYAFPYTATPPTTYGHAPAISPDGHKVAIDQLQAVSVYDASLGSTISTSDTFLSGTGNGFVWLDDQRFVVLEALPDSAKLQTMTVNADNNKLVGGDTNQLNGVDGFSVSLAGTGPGVIYVSGWQSASVLSAISTEDLQPVPNSDIALPAEALSAWTQDGELRWVDTDRHLHIGDVVVPGEYIWVH
jgi:hypothetical protein